MEFGHFMMMNFYVAYWLLDSSGPVALLLSLDMIKAFLIGTDTVAGHNMEHNRSREIVKAFIIAEVNAISHHILLQEVLCVFRSASRSILP